MVSGWVLSNDRMRFSIHVDAGYLYAALATRETGSSYRGGIQVDEKALIAELVAMCAADCKADPLRLLWYDAAKDSRPEPDQRRIGLLDGVRLRLGRINAFGEQKGRRPAARLGHGVPWREQGRAGRVLAVRGR